MSITKTLRDWAMTHHGPRVQAPAISHTASKNDLFEAE
jgi:hypothetical protein